MVKKKKKYFEFKTHLMDPKDFKHEKIELYVEPRAYKRVKAMLHKIEESFKSSVDHEVNSLVEILDIVLH